MYDFAEGLATETALLMLNGCLAGTDTLIYVMPSTSGRTSAYPTRASKLPFFVELRTVIDKLKAQEHAPTT